MKLKTKQKNGQFDENGKEKKKQKKKEMREMPNFKKIKKEKWIFWKGSFHLIKNKLAHART